MHDTICRLFLLFRLSRLFLGILLLLLLLLFEPRRSIVIPGRPIALSRANQVDFTGPKHVPLKINKHDDTSTVKESTRQCMAASAA